MTTQTDIAAARKLADMALDYAAALQATLTSKTLTTLTRTERALFDLCNAAIDLVDDGDFMAQRDIQMGELSCDEDGTPVNEYGWPYDENALAVGYRA